MTDRELAGCALLPCPFCGGEAKRDDRTEYQSYSASESQSMGMGVSAGGFSSTTYAIQCGCGIRVQGNNDAFLIERWNRRTPSSEGDGRDGEIARLNAALRYEQHRADRIGTHGPRCETWGPAHYECLLREVEGLRRDAERLDWLCAIDPARRVEGRMGFRAYEDVAPLDVEHSRWIALTDRFYGTAREAIDAAMSATGGDK